MMNKYKIIFLAIFFNSANAAIPEYNVPTILARANISDGYNIPPMSFLNNTSPVINNSGDVAFKIAAVSGTNMQVLWFKKAEEADGKIVYEAPDERFLTEPSLNNYGKIAFNLFDEDVTDGLFLYDSEENDVEQVLSPDNLPIQHYTYPHVQSNNHILFRATDDNNERSFNEFDGTKLNKLVSEGVDTLGFKSSYLFRPSFNEKSQIAFKSRMGEKGQWDEANPDSIILFDSKNPTNKMTTIARDHDSDTHSPYYRFGNSVSLANNGAVAFMGILSDNKKVIVVSKDNVLTQVALEGTNDILEIEMFAPKINDKGMVLFRARDMNGKRSLFLVDGHETKKIISEGAIVETDLGAGKILDNPNYPGFGGEVDMNDQGDIVFYCIIVSEDNKELGSAIYKISPK